MEALVFMGLAYVVLDWLLGMTLRRCVLPGLRCRACRDTGDHHGRER